MERIEPIPVGVVGCGRMGRFHARVYGEMPEARLVGVYDRNPDIAADAASRFGTRCFSDIAEMLPEVRAVTIATPTVHHAEVARPFLERGIACLIEKPLAADAAEARRIVEWSARYGAPVQVGHIERFNPAIRAVARLKPRPRFIEAIRISPLSPRSLDVSVVLDLMIHDIDIILNFVASPLTEVQAVGASLVGSAEDVCNARLSFADGCVANITASRMALKTERKLRLFCADAFISADYQKRQAVIVRRGENLDAIRGALEQARSSSGAFDFTRLVHLEPLEIEPIDPLRAELEAFLGAVRTKQPIPIPASAGLAAVEVAERILHAIRNKDGVTA